MRGMALCIKEARDLVQRLRLDRIWLNYPSYTGSLFNLRHGAALVHYRTAPVHNMMAMIRHRQASLSFLAASRCSIVMASLPSTKRSNSSSSTDNGTDNSDIRIQCEHVDSARAPLGYDASATVYPELVSEEEESILIEDLKQIFQRRRYERGHWDAVIVKYKETELFNEPEQLFESSRQVLQRIRDHLTGHGHVGQGITWLPCHAIELHPEGELRAHIDSVRFSGGLVAGLSLGTASIMRLKLPLESRDASSTKNVSNDDRTLDQDGFVDLFLPRRSVYALTGKSRYNYTHELLADGAVFGGTGEHVSRKVHRWSIIFRDAKPEKEQTL